MSSKSNTSSSAKRNPRGWITPLVDKASQILVAPAKKLFLGPRDLGMLGYDGACRRAWRVDTYVTAWCLTEILCFALITLLPRPWSSVKWPLVIFVAYRGLEIVAS